jgi:hypothetical protein
VTYDPHKRRAAFEDMIAGLRRGMPYLSETERQALVYPLQSLAIDYHAETCAEIDGAAVLNDPAYRLATNCRIMIEDWEKRGSCSPSYMDYVRVADKILGASLTLPVMECIADDADEYDSEFGFGGELDMAHFIIDKIKEVHPYV